MPAEEVPPPEEQVVPEVPMEEAMQAEEEDPYAHFTWAAREALGDFRPRRVEVDPHMLGTFLSTWQRLSVGHARAIQDLERRLENEWENYERMKAKIEQGVGLMHDNGTIQDPRRYDPLLLDLLNPNRA